MQVRRCGEGVGWNVHVALSMIFSGSMVCHGKGKAKDDENYPSDSLSQKSFFCIFDRIREHCTVIHKITNFRYECSYINVI